MEQELLILPEYMSSAPVFVLLCNIMEIIVSLSSFFVVLSVFRFTASGYLFLSSNF